LILAIRFDLSRTGHPIEKSPRPLMKQDISLSQAILVKVDHSNDDVFAALSPAIACRLSNNTAAYQHGSNQAYTSVGTAQCEPDFDQSMDFSTQKCCRLILRPHAVLDCADPDHQYHELSRLRNSGDLVVFSTSCSIWTSSRLALNSTL
jgi:hypothetical protein